MKIELDDIPRTVNNRETVELAHGYSLILRVEHDESADPPWDNSCLHGPVSDWTTRKKQPGERVLSADRYSKRYYDYAEAIKIAKRDGWDVEPFGQGTKGQRAARAVEADFQFLSGWCNDEWQYLCVSVRLQRFGSNIDEQSCCGVESYKGYWREVTLDMAQNMLDEHFSNRVKAIEYEKRERRERRYWHCRDVLTT